MIDQVKYHIIQKFFENDEFRTFAEATPYGLMFTNAEGIVVFANHLFQDTCFRESIDLCPVKPYGEVLEEKQASLIELIADTLEFKTGGQRQFTQGKKVYLAESRPIFHEETLVGSSVAIQEVTQTVVKEHQHELIYQISSALSGVSNINQILRIAVGQIIKSMRITAANIMLLDERANTLTIRIDTNKVEPTHRPREFRIGEGLAGKCAETMQPYSIPDVCASDLFARKNERDHGALLVVPITSRGKLYGVLNVTDEQPRYFTENEVQFLTIVANEIAVAIENSLLYERLNKKIQQLSKLFWVSSFIGINNLDMRLQKIVKTVPELLECEGSCVYLFSPSLQKATLRYYADQQPRSLPSQIDIFDKTKLQTIFSERKTFILNSLESYEYANQLKRLTIHNVLSTPILVNNSPIGMVTVYNKHCGTFDEEDCHLVTIIANRLATKIENAQLIRKVQSDKELLGKTIQNISDGVAVLDRKRKIIIWNRYLEELTGLKAKEVIGQPCYKIFYNKLGLKQLTQDVYAITKDTPTNTRLEPVQSEAELRSSEGEKIWVSSIYSFLFDSQKNIENIILVFRNITQDREFMQAKNEFVSMTTHELRTPLTAIKGYLSMILRGDAGTINVKQQEYFNKAYIATERLVQLVEELLDVVRIDEDRMKFQCEPFTINELVRESAEEYMLKAQAKNISLACDCQVPLLVFADANKTKHILCNLVDNAIKYTREKGVVRISVTRKQREAVISVEDSGVGIPTKYQQTVFDRFVRVPNPLSVKAGGAGLGLYIVKNLVEKQGGKIWVTSQPGKQTIFSFTLPLAEAITQPKVNERSKHERTK